MVLSLPLASPLEDFFEIFYACFGVIRHYYFSGGIRRSTTAFTTFLPTSKSRGILT